MGFDRSPGPSHVFGGESLGRLHDWAAFNLDTIKQTKPPASSTKTKDGVSKFSKLVENISNIDFWKKLLKTVPLPGLLKLSTSSYLTTNDRLHQNQYFIPRIKPDSLWKWMFAIITHIYFDMYFCNKFRSLCCVQGMVT